MIQAAAIGGKKRAKSDQCEAVIQVQNDWQTNQNTIRLDSGQCSTKFEKKTAWDVPTPNQSPPRSPDGLKSI